MDELPIGLIADVTIMVHTLQGEVYELPVPFGTTDLPWLLHRTYPNDFPVYKCLVMAKWVESEDLMDGEVMHAWNQQCWVCAEFQGAIQRRLGQETIVQGVHYIGCTPDDVYDGSTLAALRSNQRRRLSDIGEKEWRHIDTRLNEWMVLTGATTHIAYGCFLRVASIYPLPWRGELAVMVRCCGDGRWDHYLIHDDLLEASPLPCPNSVFHTVYDAHRAMWT